MSDSVKWCAVPLSLACAAATLFATAPPTGAESLSTPSAALVSSDGITFSASLTQPLFSAEHALVPSGSLASDVWIRNPTDRSVVAALSLTNVRAGDPDLGSVFSVGAEVAGGNGSASAVVPFAVCAPLLTDLDLAPGASRDIDLTLQMSDVTATIAQAATASFDLHVSMWDEAGPPPVDLCGNGGVNIRGIDTDTALLDHSETGTNSTQSELALSDDHSGRALVPLSGAAVLLGVAVALFRSRRHRGRDAS